MSCRFMGVFRTAQALPFSTASGAKEPHEHAKKEGGSQTGVANGRTALAYG
jgi:hypothetical protein